MDWSCLSCCAFNKHSYTQSVINTNVVHKRITSDRTSVINPRSHRTGDLFQIAFRHSRHFSSSFNGRAANGRPAKLASSVGNCWCLPDNGRPARPLNFFSIGGLLYSPRTTRRVASAQHCAYGRRGLGACSKFFNFSPRCAGRPGEGFKSPPDRMHPRCMQAALDNDR